ncbi:uncharacterized protein LOC118164389 [Oxyura jamaicensis]|uniref:uncharacterized protein LOC118164389 n=1 Tax=Oxyura jamaicensis TaxID=8884 RepID=UPI0015A67811|nr:uncharacterized protein LOC118164389 [Oxyura jamaicensis]XP_035177791.1 uncharacterized protein LOC118164389 [Oxyura jamaicensis]XP_035177792.1 uncharacterized protein LOC118164389 [Oxyura jamaicensis]
MVHLVALSKRVDGGGRDVMLWGSRLVNHLQNLPMRPLERLVPSQTISAPPQHLPPPAGSNKGKRQSDLQKPWDTRSTGKTPPFFSGLTLSAWVMGFLLMWLGVSKGEESPHRLYKWSLILWDDSKTLKTNITAGSPSFNITNCELFGTVVGYGGNTLHHGCSPQRQYSWGATNVKATYWCPRSNRGKSYCNSPGHYYCAYWGCETIATPGWWATPPDEYLRVTWIPGGCREPTYSYDGSVNNAGTCKSLEVTILQPQDPGWVTGRNWGVRFWEPGTDRGVLILIKKEEIRHPQAVGPNKALKGPQMEKLSFLGPTNATFLAENNTTVVNTNVAKENPFRK